MVKDWFAVIDLDLVAVVEDLKKVGSLGVGVAATRAAVAEQPSLVCCPPNEISFSLHWAVVYRGYCTALLLTLVNHSAAATAPVPLLRASETQRLKM